MGPATSRRRRRGVVSVVAVAATLLPAPHTASAVLYCTLGALLCLLGGSVLAATPVGPPLARQIERALSVLRDRTMRLGRRRFEYGIATLSFVILALTSVLVFERTPAIIDSALYLFEAKVFASGRLVASVPPLPDFFAVERMLMDGDRWYSVYPPGFPLVLALGVLAGLPWLVNPLLGAGNAILVHRLARRWATETEARVAAVIAGLSPFVMLMGGEYTSHPTSLFAATVFMLAVMIGVERRSAAAMALAGLAGGFCFVARPYTAASVCVVFAVVGIASILRRRDLRSAAAGITGAAIPLGFVVFYNLSTTGEPDLFGYAKLYGEGHLPGFGSTIWGRHTPWRGLVNTLTNLNALNKDLLQLPLPALALPAALFAFGRAGRWDRYLLLSFVSLVVFHFFYGYQSLYLGPKFLYDGISVLAILSARGIGALARELRGAPLAGAGRQRLALALALAVLVAFPLAWGRRLAAARAGYSDPTVVRAVERAGLDQAVVFVPYHPVSRFAACFGENVPDLDGPVVYALDRGEENRQLARVYPDRRLYRWEEDRLMPLRARDGADEAR